MNPDAAKVEALTSERPFVTIAMPSFNEERHIESCIRSVQAQDYPRDRIEILVADGRSTDGTRDVLARLAVEDPRIRLVDNPDRLQAAGLNRIIREARGDVIVRMDVHCDYAARYVSACVDVMRTTGADNVGGAAYRSADNEGYVDTVFLGAFRRSVFESVGMYDDHAITNEDAELNQRLLEAGGKIYLSRDIEVYYFPRESLRRLAVQYFKYGQGRARTLLKHRRAPKLRSLMPFLVVTGGAALAATSGVQPFTLPALAAYALVTGAEAVRVGRQAGWGAVPIVWAIFPTLHVAHGLGFARGLVRYSLHPDWDRS